MNTEKLTPCAECANSDICKYSEKSFVTVDVANFEKDPNFPLKIKITCSRFFRKEAVTGKLQ